MKRSIALSALLAAALGAAPLAFAQQAQVTSMRLPAPDVSPSLRSMAESLAATSSARQVVPLRLVTPAMRNQLPQSALRGAAPATALQTGPSGVTPQVYTGGTLVNVDGIPSNMTVAPPDPVGAVGETQYVQWVNNRLAVFDKASGAMILGPLPGNALFAGMSGSPGADACRESNFGDPIVVYDKLAKRWLLTQFGWDPDNTATGPYYQCIAVSTSPDATGSYYRYSWDIRNSGGQIVFPDYPKVGVWPDAFYFTWVLFENPINGGYLGPRACGVDRAVMLAGGAPLARCYDFGTAYGPVLPADLDGTMAPPAGSPNYMLSLDFGADGTGDHLFMW
ncbi:MAG TPA: hypothetical protein VNT33_09285, partial [Telluria sp.]|nr:hypothetical protein [Telluria sp.]